MIVAPEHDLLSTTRLCELRQCTPRKIEQAAEQANVAPALRLNGQVYWDAIGAEKITKQLSTGEGGRNL